MDWLVKNAQNRDVERQHLNKILQEIRATIDEVQTRLAASSSEESRIRAVVTKMLTTGNQSGINVTYNTTSKAIDFAVKTFTIQLTGAVTGTGTVTGLGNVSITTTLADSSDSGIDDAPQDGFSYWRNMGTWVTVPFPLETLQYLTPGGVLVLDEELNWYARTIEGTASEIDVADGDGIAGNPVISVAPEIRQGVSRVPMVADGIIHGRRAVSAALGLVYHPALATPADGVNVYGIAANAAVDGDTVEVHTQGPMTDASWTWVAGPVYVADEGVLSQTAPTMGWIVTVGMAIAPDTIDIHIQLPILRS